ncbi:MAG: TonB-dependent receptor [Bryobacterales bacterium]|nr:TonB-dependent receptor [Bryobacterales bacterium]
MSKTGIRRVLSSLAVVIAVLCLSSRLHAQTVSGTILGTVQDQQGAVIAKATVSAKSADTGITRTAVSDENGSFRIVSVPAGAYEISTTAPGFKTEVRTGVQVTVGGEVNVPFSLTVGAVTEKVEVTGEAAQVDVSSSTLAGFVNATTIRELPLNGRDWLQLTLLQPGTSFNTGQNQLDARHGQRGNGTAISISGGRVTENSFRIDGIVVNDYANAGPGSTLRVNMGVDAIREFSVLTNSYSTEYGMSSSGVVNAITKSGTNEYHGGGYYFHRNSALDARNFFDAGTIPAFRRHQYGGYLGGAVKKDKTFFFGNYESLREVKSLTVSVDTLSPNARKGILCSNPPSCTSTKQVTVDSRMIPYLPVYPEPNGAVAGDVGKFSYGAPRSGLEHYYVAKMDHYFSSSTTLSGTYNIRQDRCHRAG